MCDIILESELIDEQKGKQFVAGQNNSVSFDIKVRNTGIEPAYGSKISISSNFDLPDEIASTGGADVLFSRTGVRIIKKSIDVPILFRQIWLALLTITIPIKQFS